MPTYDLDEDLRNFHINEERKAARRRMWRVVGTWFLIAGAVAILCWFALRPPHDYPYPPEPPSTSDQ